VNVAGCGRPAFLSYLHAFHGRTGTRTLFGAQATRRQGEGAPSYAKNVSADDQEIKKSEIIHGALIRGEFYPGNSRPL
jgi:4-aminobutyrate aminotransferase-like enzyme